MKAGPYFYRNRLFGFSKEFMNWKIGENHGKSFNGRGGKLDI